MQELREQRTEWRRSRMWDRVLMLAIAVASVGGLVLGLLNYFG